jgi:5-formyltetrahydrofolate cyclo-ligase
MIGKTVSMGFDLATLPMRMTYRGARAMLTMAGNYQQLREELRGASDEIAREIQTVLAQVDAEMAARAAHLNPEEKQQAAALALDAAEKHLSMAAVNMLRALWLATHSNRQISQDKDGLIIEHDQQRG